MATAQQRPHPNIRSARCDDAPALREIFNDAVEEGLATFDSTLRSIPEQKHLIAMAEQDSQVGVRIRGVRYSSPNSGLGFAVSSPLSPMTKEFMAAKSVKVNVFVRCSYWNMAVGVS